MTVHVLNLEHFAGRSAYNLHDEPGRPPRSVGLGGGKERRRSCQSRSCREAGSAWRRRGDERGPSDPAGVPAFAGGPGSSRAGTGNLLCSSGTEGRHRYGARRGVLAAMPYQHHDHSALQRSPAAPRREWRPWCGSPTSSGYPRRSTGSTRAAWEMLDERFPQAAEPLVDVGPEILALTCFPVAHWS